MSSPTSETATGISGRGMVSISSQANGTVFANGPEPNHFLANTHTIGDSAPTKRTITIEPQDYGYIVRVGCQTLCISKKEDLIEKLVAYLSDPFAIEQKYNKGELFK